MFNKRAVNSDKKQTLFRIKMFQEVRLEKHFETKVKEAKRKIQVGLMKRISELIIVSKTEEKNKKKIYEK